VNRLTLWWQRHQAMPTLTVQLPWEERMRALQNALGLRGADRPPMPRPSVSAAAGPDQPHLPPGVTLAVPDGVPPGWPWTDQRPEGWWLCARSCGLWFATIEEMEAHAYSTDAAVRAACADLGAERQRAYGRGAVLRAKADPERWQRRMAARREHRRDRWATDPEYRERLRARDRERKRRSTTSSN
jgi:hypothetical protein